MAIHVKLQAQQTEKTIKEESQKLYQFLRAEETAAVRKEAALKSEAMDTRLVELTTDISSLTDNLQTLKMEIKVDDMTFMLNVKSTLNQSIFNLPDPADSIRSPFRRVQTHREPVIHSLEEDEGHHPIHIVIISDHMTRSTTMDKHQTLPENPERKSASDVLGSYV